LSEVVKTEALPSALPIGRNTPRSSNKRSWLDRIKPSAVPLGRVRMGRMQWPSPSPRPPSCGRTG
jgi:homogentisate 1,2-dioxygenase